MSKLADRLGGVTSSRSFALDVVGIGALNLDYIANASLSGAGRQPLTARIADLVSRTGPPIEWGTERRVDDETIHAALETASSARPETSLGGSAFNAIYAIASTQVGLRLGYVGVAGRVPVIGVSSIRQFEALGIDHTWVLRDDEHLCGICFSICSDGDRTLLTHDGANELMADHLDRHFDEIVAYLASARVVHVTSFLDAKPASRLAAVLRAVKAVNRQTLISFDPGHVWSIDAASGVCDIIRISDFLLVNYREFCELGKRSGEEPDLLVAGRLLSSVANDQSTIIVKRAAGILAYWRRDGEVVSGFYPQVTLPADEVADATGAGDVFAAGLLIVLTSGCLQVELGSLLGMRLARHKLRYVGSSGHAQLAEVTRDFISALDSERRIGTRPRGVFIAHGRNPVWHVVQRFIEQRFELPVYSFESSSWSGRQVTDALSDYLDRCGLAICVLTADDFAGDGRRFARQNVIHEVGLFQGRHGFDRVFVLAEDGCEFVPPAAKPYTINFPANGIERTFYRLVEMIRSLGRDIARER